MLDILIAEDNKEIVIHTLYIFVAIRSDKNMSFAKAFSYFTTHRRTILCIAKPDIYDTFLLT